MAFDYNKFLENQDKAQTQYRKSKKNLNSEKRIFLNYERTRTEQGGGKVKSNYFSRKLSF